MRRFLGIWSVVMVFMSAAAASSDTLSGFRIIRDVAHEIYVTSESNGNPDAYQEALTESGERMKELMRRESYIPSEDLEEGFNVLQIAAKMGLYPIVEAILEFEKGRALLESLDPVHGLTPLDLARLRIGELRIFFDTFSSIPFISYFMSLSFYCDFHLYDRTIEALKKQGAKARYSTKELWTRFLEKGLETLAMHEKAKDWHPDDLKFQTNYLKEWRRRIQRLDPSESTIEKDLKTLARDYFSEQFAKSYPYPR